MLVLIFSLQYFSIYIRGIVITKPYDLINAEGYNLVKCLCVDPACDWLTDSSNDFQEASSQISEKSYSVFSLLFFGSIGNI